MIIFYYHKKRYYNLHKINYQKQAKIKLVTKFHNLSCIADNTKKAQQAYKYLIKRHSFCNILNNEDNIDAIIALGGDGFMLHSLHKYMHLNIPIFGINCGTIGFLMNDFTKEDLHVRLQQSKRTYIHPLKMIAITKDNNQHELIAVNEVYIFRQTNQVAKIKIYVDGAARINEMVGDGILVATSAGSSAYNFSAGGPIIPLESNILSMTPISPFRPRRWRGALLPHTVSIKFEILENDKRPVSAVADFNEIRDVIKVEIKEDHSNKICLLFDPDHSLEERIIREQFAY
jgi:NAD+ kinase